jgi:hypothetical protein
MQAVPRVWDTAKFLAEFQHGMSTLFWVTTAKCLAEMASRKMEDPPYKWTDLP